MNSQPFFSNIRKNLHLVALGALLFVAGIFAGQTDFVTQFINTNPHLPSVANASLYPQIWDLIHSDYFNKKVDDNALFYSSVEGMVSSLNDPATLFLPPDKEKAFEQASSGDAFAGIGVALGYKDNKIIVQRILPSTPATNSDLVVGDTIVGINGKSTSGQDIATVADEIRGTANTKVSLEVTDVKSGQDRTISITREPIHVDSMYIEHKTADDGKKVDVLTVSRFTDDTVADWETKWDQSVQTILSDNPDGLVIDLRDNPGGFFDAAIYALSDFLPKNSVGAMQEDRNGEKIRYYTQTDPKLGNIKVSILVNANTASAAEIFSGAMQYYKKATIIGTNTYGKGTAQKVYDFSDGSSLHLTTDHWLLPSSRWIQKTDPIKPDIAIDYTNDDFLQGNDPQMAKGLNQF